MFRTGNDLSKADESEKTLSIALIGFAGGACAGIFSVLAALMPQASNGGVAWGSGLALAGFVILTVSVVFGGRGIAYGPQYKGLRDNFNVQAMLGALGLICFIAMTAVLIATRTDPQLAKDVATLQSDIAVLRGRAEQASKDVSQGRSDSAATRDALKDLVGRLSGEADRLARLEASRDKVTADTSEIRQRLSAVERDLKRLADQATAPRAPAPEPPSGDERPEAPPPSGNRL